MLVFSARRISSEEKLLPVRNHDFSLHFGISSNRVDQVIYLVFVDIRPLIYSRTFGGKGCFVSSRFDTSIVSIPPNCWYRHFRQPCRAVSVFPIDTTVPPVPGTSSLIDIDSIS